jgi:carboxyl-terminal processing protease
VSPLGWGPLAAPWSLIAALGLGGALLGGSIGWWSERAARRRWVLVGHGVILLAVATLVMIPLYRSGMIPLPGETRSANFERLWRAMAYAYPYFEQKGVDWDAMYERYYPQAAQAESGGDYWRVIAYMLAELNDGHTGLLSPAVQSGRHYFATCRDVSGAIVLDQVGAMARDAGLERGNVVHEVDGLPIEEALDALSPILHSGSTPQQRRAKAAFNVLSTTKDTLTVTVTLVWLDESPSPPKKDAAPWQPLITGERLPSGLGLIHIPTFGGGSDHDLVVEFDAALDELMDAPGIIVDLRGNGGGSTFVSDPIAERFLSHPFTYGREYYRARLPQRGWRAWYDYRFKPRGPIYTGSLVLLTDVGTFSTAENFRGAGRFRAGDDGGTADRRRQRQPRALWPTGRRAGALFHRRFPPQ